MRIHGQLSKPTTGVIIRLIVFTKMWGKRTNTSIAFHGTIEAAVGLVDQMQEICGTSSVRSRNSLSQAQYEGGYVCRLRTADFSETSVAADEDASSIWNIVFIARAPTTLKTGRQGRK